MGRTLVSAKYTKVTLTTTTLSTAFLSPLLSQIIGIGGGGGGLVMQKASLRVVQVSAGLGLEVMHPSCL